MLIASRGGMKPHQTIAIRRVLASIDQANAFLRFEELERVVGDSILLRGRPHKNPLIDRLATMAATKAFRRPTPVRGEWYFELRGLWQGLFAIGSCSAWLLYDEVDERGLAGFARSTARPEDWFFVLSRAELASDAA
jgi:hypothetical protein